LYWDTGLKPELLQGLGELAVTTAQMEELLHKIYWNAGLNEIGGPIVTDNLNPKRLSEDILKSAALDPMKANALADLKVVFEEFRRINTSQNHCLHWIWENIEAGKPQDPLAPLPFPWGQCQKPPYLS
jgi:hypothetical protein